MEKLRVIILPAVCVLVVLSACAEYPDPAAACNDLPIGRAPRHDQGDDPHPVRVYLREDADQPFTASDEHPLTGTLFADLGSDSDSEIALVACVTVTPTQRVITCSYGRANQAAISSGISPDPTVAAMRAADSIVTADFYSAHYEVSLRSVRTADELLHESYDIAFPGGSCPPFIATFDDQTGVIRTPDIAGHQPLYDRLQPYIQP